MARFGRHLAEVLGEVTALEALMKEGGDGREPLRAAAHKIAGTAGAFGFPELGESAREVERAVLADAPWRPDLAGKIGALREALAKAAEADPP